MKKLLTIVSALTLLLSSLNANSIFKGSGASFPYTVYQNWIKAYYDETGARVDYIKKGSSKGIKDAQARAVDFGGTDKPLSPKILKHNGLYQFPSVLGAITMGYNLPGVTNLKLSRAAIVAIASGEVSHWDNQIIAKENPDIKLPHKELTFVHRADGSGTTYNFTYFLSKVSKEWRKSYGAKKALNWPGSQHIGGKTNSGVAALLKQTPYSVGYIDYADAANNEISMADVENREGNYIVPSLSSFQEAAKRASLDPAKDFYAVIADPKGANSYPIISASFILLPSEAKETNKRVIEFFSWCYSNGEGIAKELGFVPLPKELVNKIKKYWKHKAI